MVEAELVHFVFEDAAGGAEGFGGAGLHEVGVFEGAGDEVVFEAAGGFLEGEAFEFAEGGGRRGGLFGRLAGGKNSA